MISRVRELFIAMSLTAVLSTISTYVSARDSNFVAQQGTPVVNARAVDSSGSSQLATEDRMDSQAGQALIDALNEKFVVTGIIKNTSGRHSVIIEIKGEASKTFSLNDRLTHNVVITAIDDSRIVVSDTLRHKTVSLYLRQNLGEKDIVLEQPDSNATSQQKDAMLSYENQPITEAVDAHYVKRRALASKSTLPQPMLQIYDRDPSLSIGYRKEETKKDNSGPMLKYYNAPIPESRRRHD